jgi:TrmH family RNA methyltransferase
MTKPGDPQYIESRQNPRLKELARLWERKHREGQGRFLIEGLREIQHAVSSGWGIEALFFCPDFFSSETHAEWLATIRGLRDPQVEFIRLSIGAFEKISRRQGPDGLLAVAPYRQQRLKDLSLPKVPLLIILEGLEKPGNLGAVLRTADAAAVDAVVMVDCAIDLFNPNVIRASQGMVFRLPVVCADAEPLQDWLRNNHINPVALTPHAQKSLWQLDLNAPTAFVLGAEDKGLSPQWMQSNMHPCLIPMAGAADSLNVSVTAAICAFEARRQRSS